MKYLLFIFPLLLVGCTQLETGAKEIPSEYWLGNVQKVYDDWDNMIFRMENKEVICYMHDGYNLPSGGVSCFPKQ